MLLYARWRRFWHCLWSLRSLVEACRGITYRIGWRTVFIGCDCGMIFDFVPEAFREVLAPFEALPDRPATAPGTDCQIQGCVRAHVTEADYDSTIHLVCRYHAARRAVWVAACGPFRETT